MIPTIEMISATEMTLNHHRNDTGGHHRNDPRNIGNGIKRTTKTGQQFSACFLFVYIASFLRCVTSTFYYTLFCRKLFFLGGGELTLDNTCSTDAIHLCLLFLRIFFCKKIFLIKLCWSKKSQILQSGYVFLMMSWRQWWRQLQAHITNALRIINPDMCWHFIARHHALTLSSF